MNACTRWLTWWLRGVCLLVALAILAFPKLPLGWFLAIDPASGHLLTFHKSHVTQAPFHLLWGLEGFRRMPEAVRGLIFVAVCALTLFPRGWREPQQGWLRRSWLTWPGCSWAGRLVRSRGFVLASGAAAAGVFYLLRVSPARNAEFADAPILPGEVELGPGMALASEALTYYVFQVLRALLALFLDHPSQLAIVLTSCLAGGVFVSALLVLVRAAAETTRERVTLFCGGALAGYAVMFCGYVETTQVELAAMALYFACAARVLYRPVSPERIRWLVLALAALSIALLAHAAGVLLLPSAAVLLVGEAARPGVPWRRAVRSTLFLRNVALAVVLVGLPYVQVLVVPFFLRGDFGNMTGGGDGIMFVPWHFDPAHPMSRYVHYALFSGRHLADLASALLVAAPLALPLCLGGVATARRAPLLGTAAERWWCGMLAAAAGCCLLVPVFWNHDFGLWGDWNLTACYFFPFNLLAWDLFRRASRPHRTAPGAGRQVIAPLLLVQLVLAIGFWLQLW